MELLELKKRKKAMHQKYSSIDIIPLINKAQSDSFAQFSKKTYYRKGMISSQ